jgi:hypothetical protein
MATTVKQKQAAKKAQLKKTTKANKDKARANDVVDMKLAYGMPEVKVVLDDLRAKIDLFQKYHLKIAQDAVGARKTGYKLDDGTEEVENVTLNPAERAGHLDKSAGIQEISDYIDRMLTPVSAELAAKARS